MGRQRNVAPGPAAGIHRICCACGALALALLLASPARAEVDAWPLLVLSQEQSMFVYPFYVRERQSVEITSITADRIEILLGSREDPAYESIGTDGSFAGRSFEALARHGPGELETPAFLMLFPWYYRTHYGRDRHVLWPLFKTSEGVVKRVVPFWFRGENSYTLFPIIHRSPDRLLLLLPPTYLERHGPTLAVFPFFLRTEHELFALPAYYRSRTPGQPARDVLVPFYDWQRDDSASRLWLLLALYGREQGPGDVTTDWLFPFYFRSRHDSVSRLFGLLGLYARLRGPGERTEDWLFPFFYQARTPDTFRRGLLFPFYFQVREPERSSTWLLPIWLERTPELSRTWIVPFWFREREALAGGSATRSWLSVLWPFFSRETVRAEDGGLIRSRTSVVPFWLWERAELPGRPETRTWMSVLWPAYERKVERAEDGELLERHRRFLIFSDHLERDGSRSFRVLGIVISEQL